MSDADSIAELRAELTRDQFRRRASTHYADCYLSHWGCAVHVCLEEIDRLRAENALLRRSLEMAVRLEV